MVLVGSIICLEIYKKTWLECVYMDSNLYVVPIVNFVVESVFKLGDVYFSPPYTQAEVSGLSFTDTITKSEFKRIQNYVSLFNDANQKTMTNTTFAITNYEGFGYRNIQEAFILVDKVCEKVDRTLDYFRLTNCQVGNFETLPGPPGYLPDGFKTIYRWENNANTFKIVPGEVTFIIQKGIGLMPFSEPRGSDSNQIEYKCIFSMRNDEVFLNCRAALTRVNEAMYMNNLNAAFIYLMTTIEMLADKDKMLQYKKVKTKILPFIAVDKSDYHNLSEYIRDLSEFKRTEIVHNGKNIYDLYTNKPQIIKELFKVTGLIIRYVENVAALQIYTFEELENKRNELRNHLKI